MARTGERFGGEHIIDVLLGADTERIRRWGHEKLTTYGLMKETDRKSLTNMLYQLVDGSLLERTTGDRPVLKLNETSWAVMRGQRTVQLLQPKTKVRKSRAAEESWEGVDTGLFENLRKLRRDIAGERGIPPFVVFNDATLRDMAKIRPGSLLGLRRIRGVGERKAADLGPRFVEAITSYCASRGLPVSAEPPRKSNDAKATAFEMFSRGESIQRVAEKAERAPGTVCGYLVEYIQSRPDARLDAWVDEETVSRVADAVRELGTVYLKPIYEKLEEKVPYDSIRIVIAHLSRSETAAATGEKQRR